MFKDDPIEEVDDSSSYFDDVETPCSIATDADEMEYNYHVWCTRLEDGVRAMSHTQPGSATSAMYAGLLTLSQENQLVAYEILRKHYGYNLMNTLSAEHFAIIFKKYWMFKEEEAKRRPAEPAIEGDSHVGGAADGEWEDAQNDEYDGQEDYDDNASDKSTDPETRKFKQWEMGL